MNELSFIIAAKRHRGLVKTQYRLARENADAVRVHQDSFEDSRRRAQIVDKRVEKDAQRLRDRRKDIEDRTDFKRIKADQEHARSTVLGDIKFRRNRNAIGDQLFGARYNRESFETRQFRDWELDWSEVAYINIATERKKDIRRAIAKWENRITERRIAEHHEDIKARNATRLAIKRISEIDNDNIRASDPTPGYLLDVHA